MEGSAWSAVRHAAHEETDGAHGGENQEPSG